MANYTVTLDYAGGKGNYVIFKYPGTTTSGTGHTSGSPLDLEIGDTVTFSATGGPGSVTVNGLAIFTDNSNVVLTNGETDVRTVASGGTTADQVTAFPTLNTGTTDNFFFERQAAAGPTAPTDITFGSDPGTASASVSITATASGGSNGTMKVSENGTTWVANGSSFTFTRGTAKTIYARTEGTGSNSSNYTEAHTVGYIAPDTSVTVTRNPSGNLTNTDTNDIVVTISNATSGETYRVLRTSPSNLGCGNTGALSGTSGTVTLENSVSGELPTAGTTFSYIIQAKRPVSLGGDNSYDNTSSTFNISRSQYAAPVISSVTNNNASSANVTATVNLSSNGSGGTLQYAQTTTNSVPSSGWQSGNTFTHPRGTTRYYWASQATNTSGAFDGGEAHAVGYIAPDTSVSPGNVTIAFAATNASVTVSNVTSGETYAVRANNGATNYATATASSSSVTIGPFTQDLPDEGDPAVTYEIFALRPTSIGGDGAYDATNDTFTVAREAFGGSTFLVDVSVTQDLENSGLFIAHSGSFGATSTSAPRLLEAGDRVGFKVLSAPSGASVTVQGLSSDHWTSNSFLTLTSSYQYKFAKTGIPVDTVDTFNLTTTKTGFSSATTQLHVMGDSVQPDLTVDTDQDTYEISSSATSHTITIQNTGSSTNASVTEYQVIDGSNSSQTFQSRTGHGSLTVNSVPPNDGFPRTYALRARVTQANGGSGLYKTIGGDANYNVIATTAASANDPTIDSYGIAIYDHNGDAVTSFTSGHGLLRNLYVNNSVTLSTSTHTDVSTGLTGISTSNCVILIEGTGATGATVSPQAACTFVGSNPISVRIARVKSAQTVKITVAQYKGTTIGATAAHGFQLSNGNGDGVVDENSTCYAVKEIIDLNPSSSGQTLYQNPETFFLYVDLAQGDYPASGGVPIPCISSSKSVVLVPPTLLLTRHTDDSFKQVLCYIPKAGTIAGNYKLAMLVSSDNADPAYFGGTEPDYGIEIYKSNGDLAWHSGWRQAILNNVIRANQFTTGTNQNGNYDVTTGYDGVTAPVIIDNVTPYGMESTGQSVGISNLNEMDPSKTYIAGPAVTGSVHYYMGEWEDLEEDTTGYQGGGQHKPGIRITGLTSATINMFRYSQGLTPPTEDDAGTRHPDSYHPEGDFLIFRIV